MQKENDGFNKENLFSYKYFFVLLILMILFLVCIIFITKKLEIKDIEEEVIENSNYYEITLDEDLYENGFVVYEKNVYYRLNDVYLFNEGDIGDFLMECDWHNDFKFKKNNFTYSVVDGTKYKHTLGGDIYKFNGNDKILIVAHNYDKTNFKEASFHIYALPEIYDEYKYIKINLLKEEKTNNIAGIYLKNLDAKAFDIKLEDIEAKNLIVTSQDFKINFTKKGEVDPSFKYIEYSMFIDLDTNLSYQYNCLYDVVETKLYIQDYMDQKTGNCFGISNFFNIENYKE